jgi:hypothetical protein
MKLSNMQRKGKSLCNWGDEDDTMDDDENAKNVRDWLVSGDENPGTLRESGGVQTEAKTRVDTNRVKQLDLEFVRSIAEEWPALNPVQNQ